MDPILILIIILLVCVIGAIVWLGLAITKKPAANQDSEAMRDWMKSMQNTFDTRLQDVTGAVDTNLKHVQEQLSKTSETLNQRVDASSKTMSERLDRTQETIGKVEKELGSMTEIGRGMKDLQDFMRSPKLRGNIGEQVLNELLQQTIPRELYTTQYEFKGGYKVDAVIKVEEGLIPIDSKFSLENFNAMMQSETAELREAAKKRFRDDVKIRIKETSKYILPDLGTVDFALMYVPSEAIYYEIIVNNHDLNAIAWESRVLPVSPNTMMAYLKAVLIGVEGKKVQAQAKEILQQLRRIKIDSTSLGEDLRKLEKHLSNAANSASEANKNYEKMDTKIGNVSNLKLADANDDTPPLQLEL